MKFGRNLSRNQVPEWDTSYINYKSLKKLIKSAVEEVKQGEGADTAEFFFSLDRNLEDVDTFYNRKLADAARRLKLLQDRYGKHAGSAQAFDREEMEDLMGALLELRGLLRKLQWYGEVNRRGFVKITKKLDKKVGQTATQARYLDSKVEHKQFATNANLTEMLNNVNDWLAKIKEVKIIDDGSSTQSSHTLNRVRSRSSLVVPPELLELLERAIKADDASALAQALSSTEAYQDAQENSIAQLYLSLLQRAISSRARTCIKELLARVETLEEDDDINKRNCLHRLIIAIGRSRDMPTEDGHSKTDSDQSTDMTINGINYLKPAAPPVQIAHVSPRTEEDAVISLEKNADCVRLLEYILDNLRPTQRPSIQAKDMFGRLPLHYAAQYGFVPICEAIVCRTQAWGLVTSGDGIDETFETDVDGYSPLHLSVLGGHPLTTKFLLDNEIQKREKAVSGNSEGHLLQSSAVLAVAVKADYTLIVQLLVDAGIDIDYQDDQGETALHIAARLGHVKCGEILLSCNGGRRADTERVEKTFGWTPLHVASVDGQLGIVKCLLEAGATPDLPDASGWTAREHAALRGHIKIAQIIADVTQTPVSQLLSSAQTSTVNGTINGKSLTDRKSSTQNVPTVSHQPRRVDPIKTFGHRYLSDETMIQVSLGSMDMRKEVEPVNLDRIPWTDAHSTQLDTALSVIVSASGARGDSSIIDLPIQYTVSTEPIVFTTKDASKVKLMFDIVPTYAGSADQIVGRGVALLSSVRPSLGSNRMSLQGDLEVPIMAVKSMDVIGSVHFNFLIITPFTHPNMSISEEQTYWKSMASTMVIGHRGLGKNSASRGSLQLGENTIQSFIAAANLGASYVEFDVQLTKDLVPVIYHDFLVSETGIDAPVHTLTLEQFLHVSNTRSRPPSPVVDAEARPNGVNGSIPDASRNTKARSMSLGAASRDEANMSERMKHTRDFKAKGFKANSRGNFIQSPFTTLEEMFTKLPPTIGFNIEIKYPMLHESEEQEMDAYAVELNSFIDTVLSKVYDYHTDTQQPQSSSESPPATNGASTAAPTAAGKRNVIFSSFNPDVCLMLSFKQPSIPILFLTDAGTSPVGDVRASSLQEAIRFASRWNLLGVVTAATPLVLAPRLVKVVKESGLVCVSYGSLNNEAEKVKLQVKEGIDAVIVDSVLAIRKGLTDADELEPTTNGNGKPSE